VSKNLHKEHNHLVNKSVRFWGGRTGKKPTSNNKTPTKLQKAITDYSERMQSFLT
jgi:hypothetical protein